MSTIRAVSPTVLDDEEGSTIVTPTPQHGAANQNLPVGIYHIVNDDVPSSAIDLSGYDKRTIIAYGGHGGLNQQWKFARMGPGYSIQSVYNGAYVTLSSGLIEGAGLIATPYPVSWAVEPDDLEAGVYRIRWPMSPFVLDLVDGQDHAIQLANRYPFKPTRLWRLLPVECTEDHNKARAEPDVLQFTTSAPQKLEPGPPLVTAADTIIDVEGLKLGGNGEMAITTTTTTVTTSVTTVKRIGIC